MVAKVFDDLLLKGVRSGQIPARTQEARNWYREQAKGIARTSIDESRLVRQMGSDRYENRFRLGNMYMFIYDPKHKETLPYYDRFPLIFPINILLILLLFEAQLKKSLTVLLSKKENTP